MGTPGWALLLIENNRSATSKLQHALPLFDLAGSMIVGILVW